MSKIYYTCNNPALLVEAQVGGTVLKRNTVLSIIPKLEIKINRVTLIVTGPSSFVHVCDVNNRVA